MAKKAKAEPPRSLEDLAARLAWLEDTVAELRKSQSRGFEDLVRRVVELEWMFPKEEKKCQQKR